MLRKLEHKASQAKALPAKDEDPPSSVLGKDDTYLLVMCQLAHGLTHGSGACYTPAVMGKTILNEPVLILNVNYEPLHVCNTKRALALIFSGKAEIVLNGRGTIRSASAEFDLPSIIKLQYMVHRPRPRVSLSKREILRRDNYTCQYCGWRSHHLTIDHVVPRHMGGDHSWTNLVAACSACNRRKGGRTPEQANMTLQRDPFEPSASAQYRFGRHLEDHDDWEPFIVGW